MMENIVISYHSFTNDHLYLTNAIHVRTLIITENNFSYMQTDTRILVFRKYVLYVAMIEKFKY